MSAALKAGVGGWLAAWSADVPPHSYALLRIALGGMGLLSLAGLTPIGMFWPLDGLSPLSADGVGPRAWLMAHGLSAIAGWAVFGGLVAVFVAITIGFRSDAAVLAGFIGLVAQDHWNHLPLSSAHQVMIVLLFCLMWAETGRVWSVDAYRAGSAAEGGAAGVPAWPLMLMRCQIAIVYGSTGLWKLAYPVWRDGTAVHWALSLNTFHRMPWPVPPGAAPFVAMLTWSTVLFELSFPVLVLFRRTRPLALAGGIALHLGLFATLELGPFSLIMIASYLAFLDPGKTPRLFTRRPRREARSAGHVDSVDGSEPPAHDAPLVSQ
jgi:hypothetical protein